MSKLHLAFKKMADDLELRSQVVKSNHQHALFFQSFWISTTLTTTSKI